MSAQQLEPVAISEFVQWCALNIVQTQKAFDADPGAASGPRLRVDNMEVTVDLEAQVTRFRAFELQVAPLNLGYRIARQHTANTHARLTVQLEQVPFPRDIADTQGDK